MDADEQDICIYLKSWPGQFISAREICRRAASKKRYQREPDWAMPVLLRLVEKQILEADSTGHYRLRPEQRRHKRKKWVSPHIKRILERSGKDFSGTIELEEPDDTNEGKATA
jgi:hypothetical protein